MLFNSIDFAIFLPVVFILYWFVTNHNLKLQNTLILVSSYFFYGWWDWRFLSLIFFSSIVDYSVGIGLSKEQNPHRRKLLLLASIVVNIGFLGFFKYYNFFIDSFVDAFSFFGNQLNPDRLNIILPVGISFYTFQTLSYSIDVHKRKLEPTRDIIAFFSFVSFFPQLVAGPIERARNLLPQFYKKREFDINNATEGLRQILWGLFKKVVVADSCAVYVNEVYGNIDGYNASALLLVAILFVIQVYGDFSGYSDIAIGTARLLGFSLMKNFAYPFFARDLGEIWQRWHISLTTWFRDYLFYPLLGSRRTILKIYYAMILTFTISGLWHGANWTFVIWGFLNGAVYVPYVVMRKRRKTKIIAQGKLFPTPIEFLQMASSFLVFALLAILFRSPDLPTATKVFVGIFDMSLFSIPTNLPVNVLPIVVLFFMIEWIYREKEFALEGLVISLKSKIVRWSFYMIVAGFIFVHSSRVEEFVYFQF